ncbi:MAG: Mur ligase domain-containing protein, partial [Prevotellaceae bacterium]|nr:Mur ligase domain-containing protein [Prevotellaceae bacterium]
MSISELHRLFLESSGVCTDSRNIKENSLFFALKGVSFNGNDFALLALEQGANFAIVDENISGNTEQLVRVDNVLDTLQVLASYHRAYLNMPVLAITGTNGKTTTKELINAVLSRKYKVTSTAGNLNNHIGVPLTLLSMDSQTQIGVVEMGANHPKEIMALCNIAKPNMGLITNVGKGHLEGFGSFDGVKKTKGELYDYLDKEGGQIFVLEDSEELMEMVQQRHIK